MQHLLDEIHSTWKTWQRQYRSALTPVPYRPDFNSKRRYQFSCFLSDSLNFCFWAIAGLLLAIAFMLLTANLMWAIAFFLTALIISPLIPVHWIAKLAIAALVSFPMAIAIYSIVGILIIWGFWVLIPKQY
ncbi:MAG: hypothetical protein AAFO04_27075 [Cyanobacteria bacterium J06592_8]